MSERTEEERRRLIEEANKYLDEVNKNPALGRIEPHRMDKYSEPVGFDDKGRPHPPREEPDQDGDEAQD